MQQHAKTSSEQGGDNPSIITWDWKAKHILTDKFVLCDMLKILFFAGVGSVVIVAPIIFMMGGWEEAWGIVQLLLLCLAGVVVITLVAMFVIGFLLRYRFTLDETGVSFEMLSQSAKKSNTIMTILGATMGNMGLMGAGMMAKAEEQNRIEYSELTKLRLYPNDHVIFMRGLWNPKPIRLYCPRERYDEVATLLKEKFAQAQKEQAQKEQAQGPSPIPGRLRWSLGALIATALLFASPVKLPPVALIAVGVFVLCAIWIGPGKRFFSGVAALLTIGTFGYLWQQGTLQRYMLTREKIENYLKSKGKPFDVIPESALGPYTLFDHFDSEQWFSLGCACLVR